MADQLWKRDCDAILPALPEDTNAYEGDPQLSDAWILNSIEELNETGRIDPQLAADIRQAVQRADIGVRKEIVFVRDTPGASGRTLRNPQSPATDISVDDVVGVDRVTIVELRPPPE